MTAAGGLGDQPACCSASRRLRANLVERIAGGLRIPGALLGLAAQPWEDTAVLSTESHMEMTR